MNGRQRRAAILATAASLALTTLALSYALVRPSSTATTLTLSGMIALALSVHAVGRTHTGG